jgi:hypothetical protein
VSDLRIFETPAGPTCGACVEERYGLDHPDVYPRQADAWSGGYCCECWQTMPTDGHPAGRPPPHAARAATVREFIRRLGTTAREAA